MSLEESIDRALERRAPLFERLQAEGTDTYRLFHGVAEGRPGLSIDRYGTLVLAQTFREPLARDEALRLEEQLARRLAFEHAFVWNHRGQPADVSFDAHATPIADRDLVCRELGVRYLVRARHRGLDPWLFLDLRAGRRVLKAISPGKSMLNLFAYTCTAGVAAVVFGAREAWNVDFSASSLAIGWRSAELNRIAEQRLRFVCEDFFPAARQLAGLPVKGRGSQRPYQRLETRRFDIIFLDPPAWSKGPYGAVDVEHDYASLFKPAILATGDGGHIIATNHVAKVDAEAWIAALKRCARKAGRPLSGVELVLPEADFPSLDGKPPLKIAVCDL